MSGPVPKLQDQRDLIVSEIKRLAVANGGKPPGRQLFERETGITQGSWLGVYWARWGDAVRDAGCEPNTLNNRFDPECVLKKVSEAVEHFGRIPSEADFRIYKRNVDPSFPSHNSVSAPFGGKSALLDQLADFLKRTDDFPRAKEILSSRPNGPPVQPRPAGAAGLVYLIASGDYYKIGRSENLEKRVKQVSVALPDKLTLVHAIRTDDPPGIEAYWHKRFADRRANGEWFKLGAGDVAAFKRRKFQ